MPLLPPGFALRENGFAFANPTSQKLDVGHSAAGRVWAEKGGVGCFCEKCLLCD